MLGKDYDGYKANKVPDVNRITKTINGDTLNRFAKKYNITINLMLYRLLFRHYQPHHHPITSLNIQPSKI